MSDILKLLRYNTGTDKKLFIDFKNNFDAVIFNSTIVAHSGSAITDLVAMYKNKYIIDPQTHIFQHDISKISKENAKGKIKIKSSVIKYFNEISCELTDIVETRHTAVTPEEVEQNKEILAKKVYEFQINYINQFLEKKEYKKYLEFTGALPEPRLIIAPYFMLKKEYNNNEIQQWLNLNKKMIAEIDKINTNEYDLAVQLVLDKKLLTESSNIMTYIKETYKNAPCKYVFIWISDFNSFTAKEEERKAFYKILQIFNEIGKKPVMAYGGYDAIFLCNKDITNRLYGVAHSVGYGETREITPVGGGMPVNKYYLYPLHARLKFDYASNILLNKGYFSSQKSSKEYAEDYFKEICDCQVCKKEVIKDNIDNFNLYNDSTAYIIKSKRGGDIRRLRPTKEASILAAKHFLGCKKKEWDFITKESLETIKADLIESYKLYHYSDFQVNSIESWCEIYAR